MLLVAGFITLWMRNPPPEIARKCREADVWIGLASILAADRVVVVSFTSGLAGPFKRDMGVHYFLASSKCDVSTKKCLHL